MSVPWLVMMAPQQARHARRAASAVEPLGVRLSLCAADRPARAVHRLARQGRAHLPRQPAVGQRRVAPTSPRRLVGLQHRRRGRSYIYPRPGAWAGALSSPRQRQTYNSLKAVRAARAPGAVCALEPPTFLGYHSHCDNTRHPHHTRGTLSSISPLYLYLRSR